MAFPADEDYRWMAHALRLATQGLFTTTPNPRVGCVIVKNQQVIGEGAHIRSGEPHAEVYALRQAGSKSEGAVLYVTLEPCSHIGRTGPCVEAVIAAKPQRVIIAMQDPNPLVAGRGIKALRSAGIQVTVGVMAQEAQALNPGFVSRMTRNRPYVRVKIAASLDGATALNNGTSQWITSQEARLDVQKWRAQSCAILTGIGTVLQDNPSLMVRLNEATRQPLRVIVDSQLQTPVHSKMLEPSTLKQSPLLIAYAHDAAQRSAHLTAAGAELMTCIDQLGKVDLAALMNMLAQRGMNDVLVEAGSVLNGALLQAGLIDEFIIYYAPKLMGSAVKGMFMLPELTQMQAVIDLQILDIRQVGKDIRLQAKPLLIPG